MTSIDAAQAQDVVIQASVNSIGGDWLAGGEVYPIKLGWGAALSAPGVYFSDLGEVQAEIFDVTPFSANDKVGYASIYGTVAQPVFIGMSQNGTQSQDLSAVKIEANQQLYISNADLNGSAVDHTAALTVAAGASLTLGTDQPSVTTGTVFIGNALNTEATDGWNGIVCEADNTAATGCTITDATLVVSSVVIQGQEGEDIDAENYASIALTSKPTIGIAPAAAGFGKCAGVKPDGSGMGLGSGEAVLLHGLATVAFDNGLVQCIGANGFELTSSSKGSPTLTPGPKARHPEHFETAVYACGGRRHDLELRPFSSTTTACVQSYDSTHSSAIDLSGGAVGGNNVICSSNRESVNGGAVNPGVPVVTGTNHHRRFNASLVGLGIPPDRDLFACGSLSSFAPCESSACTASPPGSDGRWTRGPARPVAGNGHDQQERAIGDRLQVARSSGVPAGVGARSAPWRMPETAYPYGWPYYRFTVRRRWDLLRAGSMRWFARGHRCRHRCFVTGQASAPRFHRRAAQPPRPKKSTPMSLPIPNDPVASAHLLYLRDPVCRHGDAGPNRVAVGGDAIAPQAHLQPAGIRRGIALKEVNFVGASNRRRPAATRLQCTGAVPAPTMTSRYAIAIEKSRHREPATCRGSAGPIALRPP